MPRSFIGRQWRRIPLIIRTILWGLLVFTILQNGWLVFFALNMQTSPSVPWSVPLGLLYLWVAFQYFNGRWWPSSTSSARKEMMRARGLTGEEWRWALAGCFLLMILIIACAILSYRLIEVPDEGTGLPELPSWSLYSSLLMISIVAGVSEEAGFRGYIQGPLENRYGPVFAIGVTSLMFWVVHLNHPSGPARFPSLIIMGIALGALTAAARSILPAIVTHAAADSVVFVGATAEIGPDSLWHPVLLTESGVDRAFWMALVIIVVTVVAGTFVLRRLATLTAEGHEIE
jgi:membrane protease YdiL (CAAX protease family)